MSRATDALEQLDAAASLLMLCASFCEEPETLPVFRDWARRQIEDTPAGTRSSYGEPITEAHRAKGLQQVEGLTRDQVLAACSIMMAYMDRLRDKAAFIASIPDGLLEVLGEPYAR